MYSLYSRNQMPAGFMTTKVPAISLPETENMEQYISQANQALFYLQGQLVTVSQENQRLKNYLVSEVDKTVLRELGKEIGEFSEYTFINGMDGSPYVVFRNQAGHSVIKPLSADRNFSVQTEEILGKEGSHRTIHISFTDRIGAVKTFSLAEDNYEKKIYSAYINVGGVMRYGKNKKVSAYLFGNYINWLRQNSSISFNSNYLWAEGAGGWTCTASTAMLRSPLLKSVRGTKPELMLDLLMVYGFLESRLSDDKYRIKKIFNVIDTECGLSPALSLDSKEKELLKALEIKQPVLFIYTREPESAASFYSNQLSKSNFDLISNSVFKGRKAIPVLVSEDFTTISPKCLVIEYSESANRIPSPESFEQFADAIVKNPVAFNKVFSDAFEKSMKDRDPDSAFRPEVATLSAVSSVIEWYYSSIGETELSASLKNAFTETISFHAAQWDNFDAQDLGEEIRKALKSAVSSGELNIFDRLCVPEKVDVNQIAFYDQDYLYVPERIFTSILARKLPYYGWHSTIRQYLEKTGILLRSGDRLSTKVSLKLDNDTWTQKRCLALKLGFFNRAGKIKIIKLRSNEYGKT